ncbi:condensation domain-containing protein, partial [Nocardia wallacei]
APSTPIEQIVAGVFAEVLGADRVGLDDDFFALGGNSLIATQVAARIGTALETQVPVRTVFEASTVAGLAAKVEQHAGAGGRPALVAVDRPERIPLSLAQQRMWFLNRFDQQSAAYNVPVAVRLSGELDLDALRAAIGDLITRHEVLRTVYPETSAGPSQVILPAEQAVPELAVVPVAAAAVETALVEFSARVFDVTAEVPMRVQLFEITDANSAGNPGAAREHVLAMVAHHICCDGSSMATLTRDLMTAFVARRAGTVPGWAPLAVQYADFSIWQRRVLGDEKNPDSPAAEQVAYWRQALAGLPDQLDLPSDRQRPTVQSLSGAKVSVAIDAETHHGLTELARSQDATLFMVLHTAFAVLLARLSGSNDIAIG